MRIGIETGGEVVGWFKNMLCLGFDIRRSKDFLSTVAVAVDHFNRFHPAFALNYKTPAQF